MFRNFILTIASKMERWSRALVMSIQLWTQLKRISFQFGVTIFRILRKTLQEKKKIICFCFQVCLLTSQRNFHSVKTVMKYFRQSWKYVRDRFKSKLSLMKLFPPAHKIPVAFASILWSSADSQPGTFFSTNSAWNLERARKSAFKICEMRETVSVYTTS